MIDKHDIPFCFGYVLWHEGQCYSANGERQSATQEEVDKHNKEFDQANIKGLDACKIGLGGVFYRKGNNVVTWMGTVVGVVTKENSQNVYMTHIQGNDAGLSMQFRARKLKDCDGWFYKRIS